MATSNHPEIGPELFLKDVLRTRDLPPFFRPVVVLQRAGDPRCITMRIMAVGSDGAVFVGTMGVAIMLIARPDGHFYAENGVLVHVYTWIDPNPHKTN